MDDQILPQLPEGITPDSPEYEQYMIQKGNGGQLSEGTQEPASTPSQEKLLADKYKSVEELEKAYVELQKAYSKKQVKDEPEAILPQINKPQETSPVVGKAQGEVDLNTFVDEFVKNGNVSDKSYKELEKQGLNKAVVDMYIKGVLAESERYSAEIYNVLGGKEKFGEIASWAREALPEDELDTLNEMLASGNIKQAKLAAELLNTRFTSADVAPKLISPSHTVPTQDGSVFRNQTEMANAMRDPRYKSDPAYRAMVEQKIERSFK